jgi:hypothetical protein
VVFFTIVDGPCGVLQVSAQIAHAVVSMSLSILGMS